MQPFGGTSASVLPAATVPLQVGSCRIGGNIGGRGRRNGNIIESAREIGREGDGERRRAGMGSDGEKNERERERERHIQREGEIEIGERARRIESETDREGGMDEV